MTVKKNLSNACSRSNDTSEHGNINISGKKRKIRKTKECKKRKIIMEDDLDSDIENKIIGLTKTSDEKISV